MSDDPDLYAAARAALLDVLDALDVHREAVTLVGAQAIYLRVGETDLAVAPFTTDGDLVIDPARLGEIPPLELLLGEAGFERKSGDPIGTWKLTDRLGVGRPNVAIDFLVPHGVKPAGGRRGARLPGHDIYAARIVRGLDGALVDADTMPVASMSSTDARSYQVRVAGPAALLVAKAYKIDDRTDSSRLSDKDALDVFRLLRGCETADLVARFERMLDHQLCHLVAKQGLHLLERQFTERDGVGVQMAVQAAGPLANPREIEGSCRALVSDLIESLDVE